MKMRTSQETNDIKHFNNFINSHLAHSTVYRMHRYLRRLLQSEISLNKLNCKKRKKEVNIS